MRFLSLESWGNGRQSECQEFYWCHKCIAKLTILCSLFRPNVEFISPAFDCRLGCISLDAVLQKRHCLCSEQGFKNLWMDTLAPRTLWTLHQQVSKRLLSNWKPWGNSSHQIYQVVIDLWAMTLETNYEEAGLAQTYTI